MNGPLRHWSPGARQALMSDAITVKEAESRQSSEITGLQDRLHAKMEPLGRTKGKDRRKLLFVSTLNNSSNHAVLTASLTWRNMIASGH